VGDAFCAYGKYYKVLRPWGRHYVIFAVGVTIGIDLTKKRRLIGAKVTLNSLIKGYQPIKYSFTVTV
jgi:hypothetical protein